jgi:2-keto-4-pentenoate hydratase/2-oxohepta-3-ene-1,7-dioic acid hydratase in catechol pathway
MQDCGTKEMIFSVSDIIQALTTGTTIKAGTVILTGTPAGVGSARDPKVWLKEGDVIEIEIEGVGKLSNPVKEEH